MRGKPWATKQASLLCKDPGPLQTLGGLEQSRWQPGASPCLASKTWAAPLSSTSCIPCHLTPHHPSQDTAPASLRRPVCSPGGARGPLPCILILDVPHTTDLPLPWFTLHVYSRARQPLPPLSGSAFLSPKVFKAFSALPQVPRPSRE